MAAMDMVATIAAGVAVLLLVTGIPRCGQVASGMLGWGGGQVAAGRDPEQVQKRAGSGMDRDGPEDLPPILGSAGGQVAAGGDAEQMRKRWFLVWSDLVWSGLVESGLVWSGASANTGGALVWIGQAGSSVVRGGHEDLSPNLGSGLRASSGKEEPRASAITEGSLVWSGSGLVLRLVGGWSGLRLKWS
eukprot:jgi/Undpi1/10771/HiC_scaffold_29.g13219.m1